MVTLMLLLACAQDIDRNQTVELQYRYVSGYRQHYDRENTFSAIMTASDLVHLALQDTGEESFPLRLLKYGVAAYVDAVADTEGHEYGHLAGYTMIGKIHPTLFRDGMNDPHPANPLNIFYRAASVQSMGTGPSAQDSVAINALYAGNPAGLSAYICTSMAGGLNQEQAMLSAYTDRYLYGGMSVLDGIPVLWEALSTLRIGISGGGDLQSVCMRLSDLGIGCTATKAVAISSVRFLSGSVIASAVGLVEGFGELSFEVPRIRLGDDWVVRWPEFESYLTQYGPTVKLQIPITSTYLDVTASLERSFGRAGTEGGLAMRLKYKRLLICADTYFSGDGYWWNAYMQLNLTLWFSFNIGYQYGDRYTFHREVYGANFDGLHRSEASPFVGVSLHHRF